MPRVNQISDDIVSVVIPNYNSGPLLKRAVKSVLAQTHINLEILVCDDGSNDNSFNDLPTYDERLRVFREEANSGSPASARNRAACLAEGKWIAFLDSDDVWYDDKLEKQLNLLNHRKGLACASNARIVTLGKPRGPYFHSMARQVGPNELIRRNSLITSSVVVERQLLLACLPFPNGGPSIYEDLALWLRVASREPFLLDEEMLLDYTDHLSGSFKSKYGGHMGNLRTTFKDFKEWMLLNQQHIAYRTKIEMSVAVAKSVREQVWLATRAFDTWKIERCK